MCVEEFEEVGLKTEVEWTAGVGVMVDNPSTVVDGLTAIGAMLLPEVGEAIKVDKTTDEAIVLDLFGRIVLRSEVGSEFAKNVSLLDNHEDRDDAGEELEANSVAIWWLNDIENVGENDDDACTAPFRACVEKPKYAIELPGVEPASAIVDPAEVGVGSAGWDGPGREFSPVGPEGNALAATMGDPTRRLTLVPVVDAGMVLLSFEGSNESIASGDSLEVAPR